MAFVILSVLSICVGLEKPGCICVFSPPEAAQVGCVRAPSTFSYSSIECFSGLRGMNVGWKCTCVVFLMSITLLLLLVDGASWMEIAHTAQGIAFVVCVVKPSMPKLQSVPVGIAATMFRVNNVPRVT